VLRLHHKLLQDELNQIILFLKIKSSMKMMTSKKYRTPGNVINTMNTQKKRTRNTTIQNSHRQICLISYL
jgi:hypothetical protein